MASSHSTPVARRLGAGAAAALLLGSSLIVSVASAGSVLAAPPSAGPVEVSGALHHDVSPPLSVMAAAAAGSASSNGPQPQTDRPLRSIPHGNPNQPDGALQGTAGAAAATTPGLGFPGVGNGDYGFSPNAAPPDPNGAVGTTQYVQWVNESFAVFDKSTGSLVLGPVAGNTLWSGFPDNCATHNDGDPIVQFDKTAQRWVMTQFVVSATPYEQCVAVSTTSDAKGPWSRYSFSYGTTQFNDYPKLGVWPDPTNNAYFISYNIFNNGTSFAGAKVCAFDRAAMLAGAAATQQCFQLSSAYGGLLPADLDGQTLPPAGSPGMFLNFTNNSLNLWRFHVDWATTTNSSLTGPFSIPGVASFTAACNGGTCIPQKGVSQQLDSLGDRLMYRLAYRNFGNLHEALVVDQSVAVGSSVGVRWYEIDNLPGLTMAQATPQVYQQATYAPDSTFRWMGSVAMDHVGDIAVGYSGSSSSVNPYVAYASRAPGDAPGTLSAETIVKQGGGSQYCPSRLYCTSLSRWGDYSAMSVDPVDDCTFWYTNEYEKTSGAFNWSTWIGSFTMPGCTTAANPAHLTLTKSVVNTGGGTALATAWTLSATGPTTISGHTGDAAITSAAVSAGTYTLAESGPTGYTPSAWSCTGGTLTGSSLVLAAGDTVSCSITNTFVPLSAHLTLTKSVVNTGGGTALATAWTLSATGPTTISGHTGDAAITSAAVSAGTYTLAESGPTGYTPSAWSCTGGTLTGSSLVLAAGDTVSCSITNTFIPPVTPPSAPQNLTAVRAANGTKGVQLSWSAPASTGGALTVTYNVYRGTTAGGESATPINTTPLTGTSYLDNPTPSLVSGRRYYYKVKAVNSAGSGPYSNEASAKAR